MTIPIEPELRVDFAEAALRDHHPAAQVLRELMRSYIKQVNAKDRAFAVETSLDEGGTQDSNQFRMHGDKKRQAPQAGGGVQTI